MDVIIRPTTGGQFILPVCWFETMLQIKSRTHRVLGISTSRLTLFHHGHRLHDHLTALETSLVHGTTVVAVVTAPIPPIDLTIRPSNGNNTFTIKLRQYWDVTIRQIKEKIDQARGVPIASQTLFHGHRLLPDHLTLQSTKIEHHSVLDLVTAVPLHLLGPFPPPPPIPQWGPPRPPQQASNQRPLHPPQMGPPPNSHQAYLRPAAYRQMGIIAQQGFHQPRPEHQLGLPTTSHQRASGYGNNQRLIVRVMLPNQAMPVQVEVNRLDRVETLRRALCKAIGRSLQFPPLPEKLCFYHEQRGGMFYEETFEWHDVKQGDLIYFYP